MFVFQKFYVWKETLPFSEVTLFLKCQHTSDKNCQVLLVLNILQFYIGLKNSFFDQPFLSPFSF